MSDSGGDGGCVEEIPYDGIDQDCDGTDLTDVDGDGHDARVVGGDDCDDEDETVFPGREDVCRNLVDDDCDGRTDDGCALDDAGPPDPGGYSWVCGPPASPGLLLTLLAVLWVRR